MGKYWCLAVGTWRSGKLLSNWCSQCCRASVLFQSPRWLKSQCRNAATMPSSAVVQRDVTVQHGSQWQKQVSRSYTAGQGSKETCRRAPRLQNASRASHRSAQQRLAGAIMGATASPSTPSAKIEAARLGGPGPRVLEGLEPIAAAQLIIGAREAGVVGLLGEKTGRVQFIPCRWMCFSGEKRQVQGVSCKTFPV